MTRFRTTMGHEDMKQKFNTFGALAIPVAFINGLYFGAYGLRKIRQYWEGGPMD